MDFYKIHHSPKIEPALEFNPVSDLIVVLTCSEQLTSVKNTPYYRLTCQLGGHTFNTTVFGAKAYPPGSQLEAKLVREGEYINIQILKEYGVVEVPVYKPDVDSLYEKAMGILSKITPKGDPLEDLIVSQFVDDTLKDYKKHQAGKPVHHGYPGGMIEHVTEMLTFYAYLNATKILPPHRTTVVLLGIIFHDYGKTICHSETTGYTPLQRLFNHIYISTYHVQQWFSPYVEKNPALLNDYLNLLHCILAHHKVLEHGSPVLPTTPEAHILICVDKLSADMNMIKNTPSGEFNKFLGAYIFPTADFQFVIKQ